MHGGPIRATISKAKRSAILQGDLDGGGAARERSPGGAWCVDVPEAAHHGRRADSRSGAKMLLKGSIHFLEVEALKAVCAEWNTVPNGVRLLARGGWAVICRNGSVC